MNEPIFLLKAFAGVLLGVLNTKAWVYFVGAQLPLAKMASSVSATTDRRKLLRNFLLTKIFVIASAIVLYEVYGWNGVLPVIAGFFVGFIVALVWYNGQLQHGQNPQADNAEQRPS